MRAKHDLIDAIDLLCEARNLTEAADMAINAISDIEQKNAMARLVGIIADRLTDVDAMLIEIRERAQS